MRGMAAFSLLSAVSANVPQSAAEEWYPQECCPQSCMESGGRGMTGEQAGTSLLGGQRLPLAKNALVEEAPDRKLHFCIGYDDFGTPEIKCMFTPPMM